MRKELWVTVKGETGEIVNNEEREKNGADRRGRTYW